MGRMSSAREKLFLKRAAESVPVLHECVCRPVGEVVPRKSRAAFQGWQLDPVSLAPKPKAWSARIHQKNNSSFILDFGEHLVGYVECTLAVVGAVIDAPMHLKITFGEVPSEVCEPLDPYHGALSRGWLQDETFNLIPREKLRIERRVAFRYVKFEITKPSFSYGVRFTDVTCRAFTSASAKKLAPYRGPKEFRDIDKVAVRTLANCMQDVFEDGPKRDRRLWLGDLRLQALTNEVTFRNHALVRRSLYLLAAFAPTNDLIRSDCYVYPKLGQGGCTILDYALLFAPTLLEYARASGDQKTARELWPLAKFQIDFVLERFIDQRGLFVDPKKYWLFIDWRSGLEKETPIQGILIFALAQLAELARHLGLAREIPAALAAKEKLTEAARKYLRDPRTGFYVSGPKRQVSWHSHAWLIIAGVITPDEGAKLLKRLRKSKDVVMPAGPYLYHYVVEAMLLCGLKQEALDLMRNYWGSMVKKGASTFWEVYDPKNDHLSPYENHHINSYCHAWSCTPSYFIRKHFR
jgi:alpha-L-rhamnosidase